MATFRVTFGIRDEAPRSWNGRILPNREQKASAEAGYFYSDPNRDVFHQALKTQVQQTFDYMRSETSWFCMTRYGASGLGADEWINRSEQKPIPTVLRPSILVHVRQGMESPLRIRTEQGEFEFTPAGIEVGTSAFFLEGDVRAERVPVTRTLESNLQAYQDFPVILQSSAGNLWTAWQEYDGKTDSVRVRELAEAEGERETLSTGTDVFHVSLAEDRLGHMWVIWSSQVDRNWDLYGRSYNGFEWSPRQRLTAHTSPDCYHQTATASDGTLWLVWQRTEDGLSQIMAKSFDGRAWSPEVQLSTGAAGGGNNWWPAVATGPGEMVAVAWDGYASGSYDVYLRRFQNGNWGEVISVADTERFEAHPTIAIDGRGRVWVAWDESDTQWGKDSGFLVKQSGTQLWESRRVRLRCFD
jgi:hypothetical protein